MQANKMSGWTTTSGRPVKVQRQLGAGGQGEVHLVEVGNKSFALKRYHAQAATTDQRAIIKQLIHNGPPAPYFLWPLELVESAGNAFGYIMELREPRFRPFEDLMARRVDPTFRALLTAGLQLADGFFQLHAKGLCYRDISFGNVFFDPNTGDIRICDNDNVDISGAAPAGVLGTPRFMAPEVVRGEASASAETDRYSLAVLLFYLLMGGHPLDGAREARIRCLDLPAMNVLYGKEPIYIFDPSDASNRPVPGLHDNPQLFHPLYPEGIQKLFLQSFTTGLHYPTQRVMESQWRKEFARARDALLYCKSCRAQCFYDVRWLQAGQSRSCWRCQRALSLPPRLRIDGAVVMLNHDTQLFAHHLGEDFDFGQPVAEVVQKPNDPSQWGLRNLSQERWTLTRPDGSSADVLTGNSVPLVPGNIIQFGRVRGELGI
ncbi:protein kinase [Archangium gephyra]|nr:protein kinase [Archangium gephyra]